MTLSVDYWITSLHFCGFSNASVKLYEIIFYSFSNYNFSIYIIFKEHNRNVNQLISLRVFLMKRKLNFSDFFLGLLSYALKNKFILKFKFKYKTPCQDIHLAFFFFFPRTLFPVRTISTTEALSPQIAQMWKKSVFRSLNTHVLS